MPVAALWAPSEVLLYVFVGFFISLTMTERIEQRYCIKFCQKLGDSKSETIYKVQQVVGDNATGVTQTKEWFNRLKNGCTSGAIGANQNQDEAKVCSSISVEF